MCDADATPGKRVARPRRLLKSCDKWLNKRKEYLENLKNLVLPLGPGHHQTTLRPTNPEKKYLERILATNAANNRAPMPPDSHDQK